MVVGARGAECGEPERAIFRAGAGAGSGWRSRELASAVVIEARVSPNVAGASVVLNFTLLVLYTDEFV